MQQSVQRPEVLEDMTVGQLCELLEENHLPMLIRDREWIQALKSLGRHILNSDSLIAGMISTDERPVTALEVGVIFTLLKKDPNVLWSEIVYQSACELLETEYSEDQPQAHLVHDALIRKFSSNPGVYWTANDTYHVLLRQNSLVTNDRLTLMQDVHDICNGQDEAFVWRIRDGEWIRRLTELRSGVDFESIASPQSQRIASQQIADEMSSGERGTAGWTCASEVEVIWLLLHKEQNVLWPKQTFDSATALLRLRANKYAHVVHDALSSEPASLVVWPLEDTYQMLLHYAARVPSHSDPAYSERERPRAAPGTYLVNFFRLTQYNFVE